MKRLVNIFIWFVVPILLTPALTLSFSLFISFCLWCYWQIHLSHFIDHTNSKGLFHLTDFYNRGKQFNSLYIISHDVYKNSEDRFEYEIISDYPYKNMLDMILFPISSRIILKELRKDKYLKVSYTIDKNDNVIWHFIKMTPSEKLLNDV